VYTSSVLRGAPYAFFLYIKFHLLIKIYIYIYIYIYLPICFTKKKKKKRQKKKKKKIAKWFKCPHCSFGVLGSNCNNLKFKLDSL